METLKKMNKISLVLYDLFVFKKTNDMSLSLIRKGKPKVDEKRIIHLLKISKDHVCYIMDIQKFLKLFFKTPPNSEVCKWCFVQFKNKTEYHDHQISQICTYKATFPTQIKLPNPNSKLSFKALGKTCEPHIICYADCECVLPTDQEVNSNNNTTILNTHQMISFAYVILNGVTGDILKYNMLFGPDTSKKVIPTLRQDYKEFHQKFIDQEEKLYMAGEDYETHKKNSTLYTL